MMSLRNALREWLGIEELDEELADLEDDFMKVCQDVDDLIPGNKEKAEAFEGVYKDGESNVFDEDLSTDDTGPQLNADAGKYYNDPKSDENTQPVKGASVPQEFYRSGEPEKEDGRVTKAIARWIALWKLNT